MTSPNTQTFSQLVTSMATAVQGAASTLVDLTVGSVLRSILEAVAAIVLWLQSLILGLLSMTRAATSSGSDLDSWVYDYGLVRISAVAASGTVTFARFTATAQAVVPVGAVVQTADGTQSFTVIADASKTAYNSGLGGYVMAAGVSSCAASVVAVTAGIAANVAVGMLNTMTGSISGVDTVTNASAFGGGADAESDAALRVRFVSYINSLSKATKSAIQSAVLGMGTSFAAVVVESLTYAGAAAPGYFFVVVDDGSGYPSSAVQTAAWSVVDAVRPIGSTFGIYPPSVVPAAVSMTCSVVSGYDPVATKALVQAAITTYINSLTIGADLFYTRLTQIAYDASPGVLNVSGVAINSGSADLITSNLQVIKAGAVVVS